MNAMTVFASVTDGSMSRSSSRQTRLYRLCIDTNRARPCCRRNVSIFIRVAAPYSLARRFLAPLLGEFCDWQPGVTAESIVIDDMADIVEHRIDIAARTGNLPDSGQITRRRRICAITSAGVTCVTAEGGGVGRRSFGPVRAAR